MGLLTFLFINVLLIITIVGFVRKPGTLKDAVKGWLRRPIFNLFLLLWMSAIMVAGWGIVSNAHLSWPVHTPWGSIDSWKLAGLLSFAGLFIVFGYSAYDNHQLRKRYEKDD